MKDASHLDLPTGPLPDLPATPEDPQWITKAWQRLPREERAELHPLPTGERFAFHDDEGARGEP